MPAAVVMAAAAAEGQAAVADLVVWLPCQISFCSISNLRWLDNAWLRTFGRPDRT